MSALDAVPARSFSMAELVERTGVSAPTVRFYLVEGLLPPPSKEATNRFLYDERHVEAVRLIRLLRERRGLSLEAIGQMLPQLLPDLLGRPDGGVFRPEMWRQLLDSHATSAAAPSTPERLLAAGLAAFCRHGHGDVTVDDVCRAADVAKGSFYRYYASKEELFLAASAAAGRQIVGALGAVAPGEDPEEVVDLVAQAAGPYLALLLDLASLAAQRRPGHGRALGELTRQLHDAIGRLDPALDGLGRETVLARALAVALRQVTGDAVTLPAGEPVR